MEKFQNQLRKIFELESRFRELGDDLREIIQHNILETFSQNKSGNIVNINAPRQFFPKAEQVPSEHEVSL